MASTWCGLEKTLVGRPLSTVSAVARLLTDLLGLLGPAAPARWEKLETKVPIAGTSSRPVTRNPERLTEAPPSQTPASSSCRRCQAAASAAPSTPCRAR